MPRFTTFTNKSLTTTLFTNEMLGNTVNELTITPKSSRVDVINKEGTCTMASQRRALKMSGGKNGEKTGLNSGNPGIR